MESQISRLLSKPSAAVRCIPSQLPQYSFSFKSPFANYKIHHKSPDAFLGPTSPPHTLPNTLPAIPTDIKGVDSAVFPYIYRSVNNKKLPTLFQCKFLNIKFIPHNHFIASARKSNVAFCCVFRSNYLFNDPELDLKLKSYTGKYSKLDFFKNRQYVFSRPFQRSTMRKNIKDSLQKALTKQIVPVKANTVSGVYIFQCYFPVRSEQEKLELDAFLESAIEKLLKNRSYKKELNSWLLQQLRVNLSKQVSENSVYAKTDIGYYPKLPFMRR